MARRQGVRAQARHHGDAPRALRAILARQRSATLGGANNTYEVALTADGVATTTVVTAPGVRARQVALWEAQDANAAAGRATTYCVCTKDTITIAHTASALARTIRIAIFG